MALVVGILIGGPLVRFDRSTADALHTYASGASDLTNSLHIVGILGSLEALALVSLLVAVVLLVQRCWSSLAAWLVAVIGGEALNLLLKDLFARPRPRFERPLVIETSYSFPSGQAMESLVVYGNARLLRGAHLEWLGQASCRGRRGDRAGGSDRVRQGVPRRPLP